MGAWPAIDRPLGTGWGSVSLLKKLDTENYNVIVISPRNYFLFTPLLPSCTTGTVEHRSIMEPIRNILRHKKAMVKFYEAEATKIDYERKVVHINDESQIKGDTSATEVPFDMLVVGVGAENATFGIPGVREHSAFLKEVGDAQEIRKRIMDCVETASFKDQSDEERKRLLHMVGVDEESPRSWKLKTRYRLSSEVGPLGSNLLANCKTFSSKISRNGCRR